MIGDRSLMVGACLLATLSLTACDEPTIDDGEDFVATSSELAQSCDDVQLRACQSNGGGKACVAKWCVGTSGASNQGKRQMLAVLDYALTHNSGASRGRCFEFVWRYLTSVGYGNLRNYGDAPDMPSQYARNFAEYMNANGNASRWGLTRLPLNNPYDAPAGAVVVVAPGSPGTSHPTAGDISIAAGGGRFINDGPYMSYGGSRAAFSSRGGRVLGIYTPH